MRKTVITIAHGNDGSDVRIGKMCRSLSTLGFEVHFVGWDRRPDEENRSIDLGGASTDIMKLKTKNGRATVGGQLKFVWHSLSAMRRQRTDILCAVNEDLALMYLPFRWVFYSKLVCDIFDPFDDRHSNKSFLFRQVAKLVSFLSRTFCDRLIATDENRRKRLGRFGSKTVVIENVPEDPGNELSESLPSGEAKIYVAGTLNENRGLRQILKAVESNPNSTIISAGWVYDDFARNHFIPHPQVDYRGIVTLADSLELASRCDAVFCFYSPATTNNLNASPNKIFDALSVGRPTIINSETKIASWVVDKQYGYQCGFEDIDSLANIVGSLATDREELASKAIHWRTDFAENYSWSKMEDRLQEFYRSIVD